MAISALKTNTMAIDQELLRGSMNTIKPKGEKVREAVKWISSQLSEQEVEKGDKGQKPLVSLIQEAAMRFNLSPKEEEFLNSFYEQGE